MEFYWEVIAMFFLLACNWTPPSSQSKMYGSVMPVFTDPNGGRYFAAEKKFSFSKDYISNKYRKLLVNVENFKITNQYTKYQISHLAKSGARIISNSWIPTCSLTKLPMTC